MDEQSATISTNTSPQWLARIARCTRMPDLAATAFDVSAALSLSATAGGMLTGPKAASENLFYFNNWPDSWMQIYRTQATASRDPFVRWALGSGTPITWAKLRAMLDDADPGHGLLDLAAQHGYVEGYALPVRTTAGHLGLVSLAGNREALSDDEQAMLQVTGTAMLNRAEAIDGQPPGGVVKALTGRERDCVALLVDGLGELEIAATLRISTVTARFHLDNARTKMRATSRAHLMSLMAGAMNKIR